MLCLEGSANGTWVQQQACFIEDIAAMDNTLNLQRLRAHSSLHHGMEGLAHLNHPASLLCPRPPKLICGLTGSAEF